MTRTLRRIIQLVALALPLCAATAQPRNDGKGEIKVRLLSVRAVSDRSPSQDLVHVVSQWTDDVARVRELLQQGADPNAMNDTGQVALSLAAVRDNRRVVRELFTAGARLEGSLFAGPEGLSWAARLAQPEITATLLAAGADPNVYDVEGFTPLLRAAYHEGAFPFVAANAQIYLTVAELLLARGADPELAKRQASGTPLRETLSTYELFGSTALTIASANCADPFVALLVRRGAGVNVAGAMNMPPLMHAAQGGCEDAVLLLLTAKAAPNQTGHQGETALVMAAMQKQYGLEHVRIVQLLLRAGASRDAARKRLGERLKDKYYRTYPLYGRTNAERIHRLLGG